MEQGFEIFDFCHLKLPGGGMATVAFCKDPARLCRYNKRIFGTPFTEVEGHEEKVIASVTFCHPKDNFCRKTGRIQAVKYLTNGKPHVWVTLNKSLRSMATEVIQTCRKPVWLKKAIEEEKNLN